MKKGDIIDRFTVVDKLGEGGMAAVYGVRHTTLGTPHALKVLTINSGDVKERMVQEGRVQARLNHPNIVAVTDVLDVNGAPGLLMEYIDGPALDTWLEHHTPSVDEALSLFRGVLAGIAHAHSIGVVHRDLKPGNVMLAVTPTGEVVPKVMDFGLAKSYGKKLREKDTRAGAMMGTPAYMPPEQIRDASTVDRRADIYALGCVLYELLCGEMAYRGSDLVDLFERIVRGNHVPLIRRLPDLPNSVIDAVDGMMISDRELRISDCSAVLDVLEGRSQVSSLTDVRNQESADNLSPARAFPTIPNTSLSPESHGAINARRLCREPMSSLPTGTPAPERKTPVPEPSTSQIIPPASTLLLGGGFMATTGLVVFLATALVGVLVAVAYTRTQPVDTAAPIVPVTPPPVPDPLPTPDPTPEPTAEPTPEPVPDPKPAPSPRPDPRPVRPVEPRPRPVVEPIVVPVPDPEPVAAPEPATAHFVVTADAQVRRWDLVRNGRSHKTSPVPPGVYKVVLTCDEHPTKTVLTVELVDGETTRIKCAGGFGICKLE